MNQNFIKWEEIKSGGQSPGNFLILQNDYLIMLKVLYADILLFLMIINFTFMVGKHIALSIQTSCFAII